MKPRKRLLITELAVDQNLITVSGDDHHYIARVLRLDENEPVEIANGNGDLWTGTISAVERNKTKIRIDAHQRAERDPAPRVRLIYGLSKGEKIDWVLQKATELGVSSIEPVICERSIARPTDHEHKHQRWSEIIRQAARQSERAFLPELVALQKCSSAFQLTRPTTTKKMIADASGTPLLGDSLPLEVLIAVGPEGGFSAEEKALAQQSGFLPCQFGRWILRTETAAIAAIATINAIYKRH